MLLKRISDCYKYNNTKTKTTTTSSYTTVSYFSSSLSYLLVLLLLLSSFSIAAVSSFAATNNHNNNSNKFNKHTNNNSNSNSNNKSKSNKSNNNNNNKSRRGCFLHQLFGIRSNWGVFASSSSSYYHRSSNSSLTSSSSTPTTTQLSVSFQQQEQQQHTLNNIDKEEEENNNNNIFNMTELLNEYKNEEGEDDNDSLLYDEYCEVVDDFGCIALEDHIIEENLQQQQSQLQQEEQKLVKKKDDEKKDRWIRVEAKPDEIALKNIKTIKDVQTKINEVKYKQSQYGKIDLYERYWEPKTDLKNNNNDDDDYDDDDDSDNDKVSTTTTTTITTITKAGTTTTVTTSTSLDTTKHTFSVAQFNILAEGLSSGPLVQKPFQCDDDQRDSNQYGGFTNIIEPSIALDFSLRRWRLIEALLGGGIIVDDNNNSSSTTTTTDNNNAMFDIIAIEEIDRYRGFFKPILTMFGYKGLFIPKTSAPGIKLGWYSDGCALFWKHKTFELLSERRISYRIGTQVMMLATLKHRKSKKIFLVAVTHLKAQKNPKNEKIRYVQVEELLEHITTEVEIIQNEYTKQQYNDLTILVLGDLNADPPCQIDEGCDSAVQCMLDNNYETVYKIDDLNLSNNNMNGGLFTTWKTRGDKTMQRIIDYIFYSTNNSKKKKKSVCKCIETLSIPKGKDMEEAKLPGLQYPSDHLMIAAKFEINQ